MLLGVWAASARRLLLAVALIGGENAVAQGGYFFDASPAPVTIQEGALRFDGTISVRADRCDRPDATLELDIWVFNGDFWPGVTNVQGYSILAVTLPAPTLTARGACVSTFSSSTLYPISNFQLGTNYITYFLRVKPSPSCDGQPFDCYESFYRGGIYQGLVPLPNPPYRNAPALPAYHATVTAIEYRHADFDHYFLTASASEIELLDAGYFHGWTRTGQSFGVRANGWSTARGAMCRFFSTAFAPKSSHFFTTHPSECELVQHNPDWMYETVAGYLYLPNLSGACPIEGTPLYRLYNNGMGGAPNHRYTTSVAIRTDMIAKGWVSEGWGDLGVIGCALEQVPPNPAVNSDAPFRASFLSSATGAPVTWFR